MTLKKEDLKTLLKNANNIQKTRKKQKRVIILFIQVVIIIVLKIKIQLLYLEIVDKMLIKLDNVFLNQHLNYLFGKHGMIILEKYLKKKIIDIMFKNIGIKFYHNQILKKFLEILIILFYYVMNRIQNFVIDILLQLGLKFCQVLKFQK